MGNQNNYDYIGIGAGPFNLGLAALSEPIKNLNGIILEKVDHFEWHPGLMLETSTLQVPFMADLVTLADPTSKWSFTNYLKGIGRLYQYYIRENFYPLRKEYSDYCRWVSENLNSIKFNHEVTQVDYDQSTQMYSVTAVIGNTGETKVFKAPKLVIGTGTTPNIPQVVETLEGDWIFCGDYLAKKDQILKKKIILLVGSGQSAAEVYLDLLLELKDKEVQLNWITRSPRFFPLEYTKLTLEMTSPDYIEHFSSLSEDRRYELTALQKVLYKGINSDLINTIYDTLYQIKVNCNPIKTHLETNQELIGAKYIKNNDAYELNFKNLDNGKNKIISTESLIMATGYKTPVPEFLNPIKDRINFDKHGQFEIARNYSIDKNANSIYLQNSGVHAHSVTSPDLGMGPYRNSVILQDILGYEVYPIEKSITFQTF